jgi:two-component system chemotaxis response regulator CheY
MATFQAHTSPSSEESTSPCVLTIDDDENIRMLLAAFLRKKYRVVAKEDGLAGMSWLYQGNLPDLIVVDVDMPRLDGFEFLRQVRNSGFFRHIPVIMLSGMEQPQLRQRCLNQGADAYLIKPFNPDKILNTINEVLAQCDVAFV